MLEERAYRYYCFGCIIEYREFLCGIFCGGKRNLGVLDNLIKKVYYVALASTQYMLHVINKGGGVSSTSINSEYVRKVKRMENRLSRRPKSLCSHGGSSGRCSTIRPSLRPR